MIIDAKDLNRSRRISWPLPLAGLRGISRADLVREISAGITLAALIIPLNIGYAQVAGLPPVVGLYAGIIPLIVFALFTSSRHVVTSPDASIAALVGAIMLALAVPEEAMRVQYAFALALMCSALFFIFWIFRLAFLANFLSRAILVGFISGLGIEVLTNQVRKILGVVHSEASGLEAFAIGIKETIATSIATKGFFVEVVALIESIPHANLYSVAIGFGALAIVRVLKRYVPRVPGALVALVLLTSIVAIFNLDERGVGVLGNIPSGLPSFGLPDIAPSEYLRLIPGAFAVVAITLCEGLLLVRRYSRKYGYKADGNQVLFSYGVANLAAGLSGSLLTGNSPSRSAAMDAAGSGSQLSSLVAAVIVGIVMMFFTDLLGFLPKAALAGIVANAVLSLIEIRELKELCRMRRSEFAVAIVCLLSVLVVGPLKAVIIAFLMASINVIRRASRPATWLMQEAPDGSHFIPRESDSTPDDTGLVIYCFGAPLFFANATLFQEEVEDLLERAPADIKWLVFDASAMVDMDTTGAEIIREILALLSARGVTVAFSRASPSLTATLKQFGLLELIDEEHRYPTNRHAIAAYRQEHGRPDPEAGTASA